MKVYRSHVRVDEESPTLTCTKVYKHKCSSCRKQYKMQIDFAYYSDRKSFDTGFHSVCPLCNFRDNHKKFVVV